MPTTVPVGDPKAVKKWSSALAVNMRRKSYFERKFMGTSAESVIQRLTELEGGPGDRVSFDLSMQLRNPPITGDNVAEGKEESLRFFTDEIIIDQMRNPVSTGGRMSKKRTLHDLRRVARDRSGDYWAQYTDELAFIYLSGHRGANTEFISDVTFAGHAGNAIQAPDSDHIIYGGNATAKNDLATDDPMARAVIEKAATKAKMMRADNPDNATMLPSMVEGEGYFVIVMSPFQAHSLRTEAGTQGWAEIQKAAAGAEGRNSPLFKGGLGMIGNVVLHDHESVIRFSDYGSGGDVVAARAIMMGRQAGLVAYGTRGGMRYMWDEQEKDYGNAVNISSGTIMGIKKARFNGRDFGVIAIDTAAANPNS